MRWAGHVAHMKEEKEFIQGFGVKSRRKETTKNTHTEVGG
jgi:hypothetical protein